MESGLCTTSSILKRTQVFRKLELFRSQEKEFSKHLLSFVNRESQFNLNELDYLLLKEKLSRCFPNI
jgi:hypothetical protein